MFGMPVEIEHRSGKDAEAVAPTLRFPNGLELPGTIINPRLYDVDAIDVEVLAMKPITVKLKDGDWLRGVFLVPTSDFVPDERERTKIAKESFLFITRADLDWIRNQAKRKPRARLNRRILHLIPKQAVEYVDIGAALGAK
jgi:hypothetical protein